MGEIGARRAEIFLLIEEIVNMTVVVTNSIATIVRKRNQEGNIVYQTRMKYGMISKIPDQVKHMNWLLTDNGNNCLEQLRMSRNAFGRLCFLLQHVGGLTDSKYVSIREKVALFLSIVSHHKKNRVVKFDFKRSSQTVSNYFYTVLAAVLKLHPILLMTPEPIPNESNCARWKHFKGCLGALDGTYIRVTVSDLDKPRYRTRKGDVAVNMLGVCDPNMKFVYVLTGWEGSAADCRVLRDALTRNDGLKVPQGNYYLCDNGYSNADGFLTPYKGVRYHLKEWGNGNQAPRNFKEYFNMCHSKARNVIERTFGLLKKRWAILRSASFYPIKGQNRIIMACALLHNFMRIELPIDPLLDDLDDVEILHEDEPAETFIDTLEPSQAWSNWRDTLAQEMFRGRRRTRRPL